MNISNQHKLDVSTNRGFESSSQLPRSLFAPFVAFQPNFAIEIDFKFLVIKSAQKLKDFHFKN